MKWFGSVKFDFINNLVQIGRSWINGLTTDKKKGVRSSKMWRQINVILTVILEILPLSWV